MSKDTPAGQKGKKDPALTGIVLKKTTLNGLIDQPERIVFPFIAMSFFESVNRSQLWPPHLGHIPLSGILVGLKLQ